MPSIPRIVASTLSGGNILAAAPNQILAAINKVQ